MYIILEVQTNSNNTVGTLVNQYEDFNQADSKFHQVLSAAAISSVPIHSAFFLTDRGTMVKSDCYIHDDNIE